MINFLALYVFMYQRAGAAACVIKEQAHGWPGQVQGRREAASCGAGTEHVFAAYINSAK